MRIAIFGGFGMLGKAVAAVCYEAGHVPIQLPHSQCHVEDRTHVIISLALNLPLDAAINCAGVTPGGGLPEMALANAAGPHVIARACAEKKIRLVHVSTDCVFDGIPGDPGRRYDIDDVAAPRDLYGRSKLTGEPYGPRVVVVRTSFIGPEKGLLAWLLRQEGKTIEGYRNAWWTGSTSYAVARRLVDLATMELREAEEGELLLHMATREKIAKHDLLVLLRDAFGLNVEIKPVNEPHLDRALRPMVPLESIDKALPELLERWKHSNEAKARV